MADVSFVPVDHDPFANPGLQLTPVEHNPFEPDVAGYEERLQGALPSYTGLGPMIGNAVSHILHIPQRAIEASEERRTGGDYNPGPVLEAAQLGMTGGLAGTGGAPAGEALGSGPIGRRMGPGDWERMLAERRAIEAAGPQIGPERITQAAVKYGDNIFTGRTHPEAGSAALNAHVDPDVQPFGGQGFLTSKGRFVTREEAANLARASGQDTFGIRATGRATAEDFTLGSGPTAPGGAAIVGMAPQQPQQSQQAPPLPSQYVNAIKTFEGYTPRAAWDVNNYRNGYGTNATHPGEVIDQATAEQRLQDELYKASRYVDNAFPGLSAGPRAALTSLTYNAGPGWINSGLGALVRSGDYAGAAQKFMEYNHSDGSVSPGLTDRRQQEASWLLGADPSGNSTAVASGSYNGVVRHGNLALVPVDHDPFAPQAQPIANTSVASGNINWLLPKPIPVGAAGPWSPYVTVAAPA